MTIATKLTTNRANMHLNGADDRAKGSTLFVELSNCVPLLTIQLVVSHCKLVFYHDFGVIDPPFGQGSLWYKWQFVVQRHTLPVSRVDAS